MSETQAVRQFPQPVALLPRYYWDDSTPVSCRVHRDCGSLVADEGAHDAWHARHGDAVVDVFSCPVCSAPGVVTWEPDSFGGLNPWVEDPTNHERVAVEHRHGPRYGPVSAARYLCSRVAGSVTEWTLRLPEGPTTPHGSG